MAPHPESHPTSIAAPPEPREDDIVITGISGLFPGCKNFTEFGEKLYNGENMVTKSKGRWDFQHPEVSEFAGSVPGLDQFDAQFFFVHYNLAQSMDPMTRKLHEIAYEAVYDAGVNPAEISRKRVGVFVGLGASEADKLGTFKNTKSILVGCNRAMFANRISFGLNLKGPSESVDASCSSSLVALEQAYHAISSGNCDAALVGGSAVHLQPNFSVHYGRMFPMNKDGKTKSFSKDADGQSMSEVICVMFLQKYKDAKRVYAKLCYAKTSFECQEGKRGQIYGPYRPLSASTTFLNNFYKDINISPSEVEFVEAFGAGMPEVDKAELEAIDRVFCKDRQDALLVGSIMSNMGYSEAATGMAALAKICLSYHKGELSANLHCESPRDDVKALQDGRIQVVTKNRPFRRSYVAMNNWGLTGLNAHALLQGVYKPKDLSRYKSNVPYLVTSSGRNEDAVTRVLEDLKNRPIDPEEIALFHNINRIRIAKQMARGFTILSTNDDNETVSLSEKKDYYDETKRQLWFVYSGMGSQWAGMGAQLMRIPVFAASIQRCHNILAPKGIDLIHNLTADDPKIYDKIINSFVGIAAVQIGLTDVLKSMGIVPDRIIGHSVGELGCAYADGCLTADEMILASYYRGLVSMQMPFIKGSMAAVGIGYQKIKSMCPPEIEVACHNGPESCTISGPVDLVTKFVQSLVDQGVFAKEVPCSNIAYHSRYIKEGGPELLKYLREVIKTPTERSKYWLSTSVPQEKWTEPDAMYSSAEYHTNNLLNPVLFEETARLVPAGAVLVEVAPHGLLQAILKRSLPESCVHVPLTRRTHPDSVVFLLEAIGNLFISGCNPDVSALYPKVQFPVSTETRSISHLVGWEHSETWYLPLYVKAERTHASATNVFISLIDDEHRYLEGHKVDGHVTYPFAGILSLVWNTLAMCLETPRDTLSVIFRDVYVYCLPKLDKLAIELLVEINRGTGQFEVTNQKVVVVSGYIVVVEKKIETATKEPTEVREILINTNDVYRILYEKGYRYSGDFKCIQSANTSLTQARITWNDNWVTFLDAIIQLSIMREDGTKTMQPKYVRQLMIDTKTHSATVDKLTELNHNYIEANVFDQGQMIQCGGITVEDLKLIDRPLQQQKSIVLKSLKFSPLIQKDIVNLTHVLYSYIQIAAENIKGNKIKVLEITNAEANTNLFSNVKQWLSGDQDLVVDCVSMKKEEFFDVKNEVKFPDIVIVNNNAMDKELTDELYQLLSSEAFVIILKETNEPNILLKEVASAETSSGRIVLAKFKPASLTTQKVILAAVSYPKDLVQLMTMRQKMKSTDRLVIFTTYPPFHGLKDLVKKYRAEPQRNNVVLAMVDHKTLENIDGIQLPAFELAFNVMSQGIWGVEVYTPVEEKSNQNGEIVLRGPRSGDIDSLHWVEGPEPIQRTGIRVKVHYAGLNYYDAKKANGEFVPSEDDAAEYTYGMDYSGTTESGSRVMGIVSGGAAASHVQAEPALLWPAPAHWSLEDAATVPLAFAHAFYILAIKFEVLPGMSILVHGATGGLGQALITVALAHKCKVFATVRDGNKKKFLRKIFPEIPEEHIGNSRDGSFVDMVMLQTHGVGVDLIISCLKGTLANESLKCAAPYGYTIDTHNLHTKDSFYWGLFSLTKCRVYIPVDFCQIITKQNKTEMKKIQLMVSEGIAKGYVRPLTRVTYSWSDASRAFRLLAASRHRGRVLLNLQGPAPIVEPRLAVSPLGCHVVVSADEDEQLPLRLLQLLVERGARRVVLHARCSRHTGGLLQMKIRTWQEQGVRIKVLDDSIARKEELLDEAQKMGPVEGVFVVATDKLDDKQEATLFADLANLDEMTRKLDTRLQYFAVLTEKSKVAQSICLKRAMEGLSATMLQLSNIDKFDRAEDEYSMDWSCAMQAIEITLRSPHTITSAHAKLEPQPDIIEEALKVISANNPEVHDQMTATLKEISCLDQQGCQKLSEILEQKFDILVSRFDIPKHTLKDLKLLQDKVSGEDREGIVGLNTFISQIDIKPLHSTTVVLPSLVQGAFLRYDEFDNSKPYLVLIPGIDSHYARFSAVAERLKIHTMVLQPGLDNPDESISEMADRFTKIMTDTLQITDKFYLLGYSSGALVALEMAANLERQGKEGVVFCVDAEPDTFPGALEAWLGLNGQKTENEFQDEVVQHMYRILTGVDSDELPEKLRRKYKWSDKVAVGVEVINLRCKITSQFASEMIEAMYGRIVQARRYSPRRLHERALQSQLVLLRSRCQFAAGAELARYSERPLQVYDLKADHARALDDISVSNIVNSHLGKEILEAYDKMNHCICYLKNAEAFGEKYYI